MTQPTPYNPNTPLPGMTYADWQVDLLNNFRQLYNAFGKNHVPLDDPSTPGNHTVVQFLDQPVPPNTSVSEIAMFAKMITGQNDQIFLKYQDNVTQFPLTNYQIYTIGTIQNQTLFFTMLPGGIICYFGTVTLTKHNMPLYLIPRITKNILSVATQGITRSLPPQITGKSSVSLIIENEIVTSLSLDNSSFTNGASLYYFVMGNT